MSPGDADLEDLAVSRAGGVGGGFCGVGGSGVCGGRVSSGVGAGGGLLCRLGGTAGKQRQGQDCDEDQR